MFEENNIIYENIAVYFIFRYLLKAVYDGDILSPLLFTYFAVKTIKLCDILAWLENNQTLTTQNRIVSAKLFSKEIEYSTENMDAIYDWFWILKNRSSK